MKINKRHCNYCGCYYEGYGKKYCSNKCKHDAEKKNIGKKCLFCGKDLPVTNNIFCNKECFHNYSRINKISNTCKNCNKPFNHSKSINKKFCCRMCYDEFNSVKKGKINCCICGKEFEIYNSYLIKRNRYTCSKECNNKRKSIEYSGENSKLYKHGRSYNNRIRKGIDWKCWRESVFKRDSYTCQVCGIKSGIGVKVELHPHHILKHSEFPYLRYDVENGITLCKKCHYDIHKVMPKIISLAIFQLVKQGACIFDIQKYLAEKTSIPTKDKILF